MSTGVTSSYPKEPLVTCNRAEGPILLSQDPVSHEVHNVGLNRVTNAAKTDCVTYARIAVEWTTPACEGYKASATRPADRGLHLPLLRAGLGLRCAASSSMPSLLYSRASGLAASSAVAQSASNSARYALINPGCRRISKFS